MSHEQWCKLAKFDGRSPDLKRLWLHMSCPHGKSLESLKSLEPDLTAGELFWKLFSYHHPNILFKGSGASKPVCHSRVEKTAIFFRVALYLELNIRDEWSPMGFLFQKSFRRQWDIRNWSCECAPKRIKCTGKPPINIYIYIFFASPSESLPFVWMHV